MKVFDGMVNALSRIVNERRANPPKGCSGVLEAQSLWKFKQVTQMQTTCKKSKTFRAKKKSGGRVDMQMKVLKPMERWKLLKCSMWGCLKAAKANKNNLHTFVSIRLMLLSSDSSLCRGKEIREACLGGACAS